MGATAFANSGEYVAALSASGLAGPAELGRAEEYVRKSPQATPRDLAGFLADEGILTAFQARYLIEGRLPDLTLGHYTLVDLLGTGAMGAVYKARSAKDGGWYAVKIVPRRSVMNLKTIADKVSALKQVRHPRVSALVNIGASGERVYLVWPYVEGGQRLEDLLQKHGKMPPRQAAQIALQIASGLQPYHEQGLFHGLLKPSDVLIGSDRRVRVMDFGVGFLLTSERGKAILDTMTNGKTLAKGLDTASPEAILDSLARSPAGDQYSLGCVLYRCLTGTYPFPYDNPVKKMLAHQSEIPTPVRDLAPDTPPALAAVVERLTSKAPEERYGQTADLVKDLQAVASNPRAFAATAVAPVRGKDAAQWREEREAPVAGEAPGEEARPVQRSLTTLWMLLAGLAAGGVIGLLTWVWLRR